MEGTGKLLLAMLALFGIASALCAIEAWLERRHMDRLQLLFLIVVAAGICVLAVALILHFGRFA